MTLSTVTVLISDYEGWMEDDTTTLRFFSNPHPVVLVKYPDHDSEGFLFELSTEDWDDDTH